MSCLNIRNFALDTAKNMFDKDSLCCMKRLAVSIVILLGVVTIPTNFRNLPLIPDWET